MTLARRMRESIENRIDEYEAQRGVGADAYCSTDLCHPMADGKCLQVLAVLRQCDLISKPQFDRRVNVVCARLESSALRSFQVGWCWGLGFSWRNLPATEPFLITSAIITRGLLDCYNQELRSAASMNVLWQAKAGLESWMRELVLSVDQSNILLPAYSPGIREAIYNTAAYAITTLKLVHDALGPVPAGTGGLGAVEWIRSRRITGVGWPYSEDSPIVDLLHQCYILNAIADGFGVQSIELASAEMVGQFAGACCFADAMRLVKHNEEVANVKDIPWLRPLRAYQLELIPKAARLWSLGEFLVLISRLGSESERSGAWRRLGRRVAEAILLQLSMQDDSEARYPRHVMHAVHGLACYLATLRKSAQLRVEA